MLVRPYSVSVRWQYLPMYSDYIRRIVRAAKASCSALPTKLGVLETMLLDSFQLASRQREDVVAG